MTAIKTEKSNRRRLGKKALLTNKSTQREPNSKLAQASAHSGALFDKEKSAKGNSRKGKSEYEFRDVVTENFPSVRFFLSRYVHCPQQIDDIAQEVFIAAYHQIEEFRGESKLRTWLLGIARNKALNFLRQEIRRTRKLEQFSESKQLNQSLTLLTQESDAELNASRLVALRQCIDALPQNSRFLVDQFYFAKSTSIVIAEKCSQTDSAVRMRLKRIRGVLQKCIGAKIKKQSL